ncbi:hypothetical protein HJG60_011625 [Phyllostomus discolor]|uniref:Uncharacterized protein n=1 Tax=Phyllostomus discolor TaxID=89673 RepID=A0A833ZZC5_9CHIR|nr:hypothetical protein HJG60_011625 [Phyllostomus discolor]
MQFPTQNFYFQIHLLNIFACAILRGPHLNWLQMVRPPTTRTSAKLEHTFITQPVLILEGCLSDFCSFNLSVTELNPAWFRASPVSEDTFQAGSAECKDKSLRSHLKPRFGSVCAGWTRSLSGCRASPHFRPRPPSRPPRPRSALRVSACSGSACHSLLPTVAVPERASQLPCARRAHLLMRASKSRPHVRIHSGFVFIHI